MKNPQQHIYDLLVFGETTLDSISHVDALPLPESVASRITSLRDPSIGGRGANVGTYAATFGIDVALLSACGEDYISAYNKFPLRHRVKDEFIFKDTARFATARVWVYKDKSKAVTFFHPGVLAINEDAYKRHQL